MSSKKWTFLTNHAQVLLCIAKDSNSTTREIAAGIGITERAVQSIVHDLEGTEYIKITKEGRRNHYVLNDAQPLRHPAQNGHTVHELLEALVRVT